MSLFYSQLLEKPRIENLCVRCETRFVQWSAYHAHVTAGKCGKIIKPVNTSGRSRAQIVQEWELKNKGAIIQ